jgi:hypothetical protein
MHLFRGRQAHVGEGHRQQAISEVACAQGPLLCNGCQGQWESHLHSNMCVGICICCDAEIHGLTCNHSWKTWPGVGLLACDVVSRLSSILSRSGTTASKPQRP